PFMSKLRYFLVPIPVVAAAALWFGRAPSSAAAETPSRPATLVAPARIEPARDTVKLSFETSGRIAEILVDEGDTVTAGQVVARLDDRLASARVAAAQAGLAQAKARYLLARRGPRKEDLAAARAEADAAAAAAQHRGAEQARSEKLGKAGAVSDSIVDADGAAARVANAQATAATARFESLARGTRTEQVEEAVAAIALAQAELDTAKVALDQTLLRAPSAGTILRRTAEIGALVTLVPPQVVATLADVSDLEVRAEIDEADIAAISVGQPAYATADAYGSQQFPVRIVRISNELGRKTVRDDDPRARIDTRVLEVIARFDGTPTRKLPLGLRVSIHIHK
ncbi:MAG: efflux RND transporter periplasmic adaptor subunit, partial [Deltaproteobacteria bacterium]|nr:efflux RND transporter periplasmic adaptor subunit [Deltaproteobacteria bacterium]